MLLNWLNGGDCVDDISGHTLSKFGLLAALNVLVSIKTLFGVLNKSGLADYMHQKGTDFHSCMV